MWAAHLRKQTYLKHFPREDPNWRPLHPPLLHNFPVLSNEQDHCWYNFHFEGADNTQGLPERAQIQCLQTAFFLLQVQHNAMHPTTKPMTEDQKG